MRVGGLPADEQRLVYEGKLFEHTCTLSDYQIPPNGTTHLNPTTKKVTVQVQSSDTVDNAKKLLGFCSKTTYWNGQVQRKVVDRVGFGRIAS